MKVSGALGCCVMDNKEKHSQRRFGFNSLGVFKRDDCIRVPAMLFPNEVRVQFADNQKTAVLSAPLGWTVCSGQDTLFRAYSVVHLLYCLLSTCPI